MSASNRPNHRNAITVLFLVMVSVSAILLGSGPQQPSARRAAGLGLDVVKDVPLPGGTSRFDYQTIDDVHRKLFISHMGANSMIVYDLESNKVVGNVPDIPRPTGILAIPELGRVYVSSSAAKKVCVVDETSLKNHCDSADGVFSRRYRV